MSNYDPIDKALNIDNHTETSIVGVGVEKKSREIVTTDKTSDIQKDYEYTRANLYSLVEKGQEALNGIMEVAEEQGSARAYEVAGQIIKSVADTTDKLVDLQKKVKEVEEDVVKPASNVTNNALFVGSTSDLSKILKQGFLNSDEKVS